MPSRQLLPRSSTGAGAKPRVMFVAHNHPAIRPGGSEGYAFGVFEATRDAGEFEMTFVARSGPPFSITERHHEGRPITLMNDDSSQYLFYTDPADFDFLYGRSPHKSALTRFFAEFLLDQRPDIVHFHHTMFLGYDILRVTRNVLPDVPIVYTLHDYTPICHRDGQMVRTGTNQLCDEASPRRCHECFPDLGQETFLMRERFIKSQLDAVDLFVAPSLGQLERYVRWGIPRDRIIHEPHGCHPKKPIDDADDDRDRNQFGFFGSLTAYKGADVLLHAMSLLGEDFDGRLWIHGANLEMGVPEFRRKLGELLDAAHGNVRVAGEYKSDDMRKLMERIDWVVVPSIWREIGPLTLLEGFQHGRPVICSDIGGMAEKTTDGVNALHFRRGDANSLAAAMSQAARTPGLWRKLRRGIPAVHSMDDHVARMGAHYRSLLTARRSQGTELPSARAAQHA